MVFITGCAVGGASARFVVPLASAQQAATLTKWEFACVEVKGFEEATGTANRMGAQGWDMAGGVNESVSFATWCFKRPKM